MGDEQVTDDRRAVVHRNAHGLDRLGSALNGKRLSSGFHL